MKGSVEVKSTCAFECTRLPSAQAWEHWQYHKQATLALIDVEFRHKGFKTLCRQSMVFAPFRKADVSALLQCATLSICTTHGIVFVVVGIAYGISSHYFSLQSLIVDIPLSEVPYVANERSSITASL